jgi:hypothetical protein
LESVAELSLTHVYQGNDRAHPHSTSNQPSSIIEVATRDIGTSCQKEADAVRERAIIAMDTSDLPQESSVRSGGTWLSVSRTTVL